MPTTLPTGVVTILFADAEKSTSAWQENEAATRASLQEVFSIAQASARDFEGHYVKNTGDGFLLVFEQPANAVLAACQIQRRLMGGAWPNELAPVRMRIGVHTGSVTLSESSDYSGFEMNRAQRIMDAAHGTQILLSEACCLHIEKDRLEGFHMRPLGACRLRDLMSPVDLYRVDVEGLAQSTAAPRVLRQGLHNFLIEDRPFIGRQNEVLDLSRLLRDQSARLVTITGMGGIGKTRLAKQVAAELQDQFSGGVWFVELDSVRERSEIFPALLHVLEVDPGVETAEQVLLGELAKRQCLIVLDCFEMLTEHADAIRRLIQSGPDVVFLVTSRVALRLSEEVEFPLEPLPVPLERRRASTDSVHLFVESVRRVKPGFVLSAANRDVVHDICRELEGIPLAIVLHAARARYFPLEVLLAQIRETRMEPGVLRHDEPRHQTLWRVVDDSFGLLAEPDRDLLCKLAVHSGGFQYGDAVEVAGLPGAAFAEGLMRLCDHSLVMVSDQAGGQRYRILDTIREYIDKSEHRPALKEEIGECRRRHAVQYFKVASSILDLQREGRWKEAAQTFTAELGNIRRAIETALASHDGQLAASLARVVGRGLVESGLWADFDRLFESETEWLQQASDPDQFQQYLALRALILRRRGQEKEATSLLNRRMRICEEAGLACGIADTLFELGNQALDAGDHGRAKAYAAKSLTASKRVGQYCLTGASHALLANTAAASGDEAGAMRHCRQAARAMRNCQDFDSSILSYVRTGRAFAALGKYDLARRDLWRAVDLATEGNRPFGICRGLMELGLVFESEGRFEDAALAYMASSQTVPTGEASRKAEAQLALRRIEAMHPGIAKHIGYWSEQSKEVQMAGLRSAKPQPRHDRAIVHTL